MPILYVCSGNQGKIREFLAQARALHADDFDIRTLPNLDQTPAPDEDGLTYEQNAGIKARYYSQFTPELVLADDSGLEVAALGGQPGIHSARFAGETATGTDNNRLLLEKMKSAENRGARFVTAIAVAQFGNVISTTRGTAEGEILSAPRGSLGFGYDCLFLYPPFGRTFAEISEEEKLPVSARGKAFEGMIEQLKDR